MQILRKKRQIYVKKRKNQMNSFYYQIVKMKRKKRVNMNTKKYFKINKQRLKNLTGKLDLWTPFNQKMKEGLNY